MKVICIDDDFTNSDNEFIKKILLVGDDGIFPKKGEVYEVIGYGHFIDGHEAYELDGLEDSDSYGVKLFFKKERFEVFDDTFVPNHFDKEHNVLCRKVNMYMEMKFDLPEGTDSEGGTWVYDPKK